MTLHRAFAVIESRGLNDATRRITGIATTPTVDRMGDVIDPEGVKVARDIPLFLYHDNTKVVGRARLGKATKTGIPFEATLPQVTEAGVLRARVDEAWQLVRYGLITAVSIGFRVIDDAYEVMRNGGLRYLETEVLELSLVPVPANPDAVIDAVKSANVDALHRLLRTRPAGDAARLELIRRAPRPITRTRTSAVATSSRADDERVRRFQERLYREQQRTIEHAIATFPELADLRRRRAPNRGGGRR